MLAYVEMVEDVEDTATDELVITEVLEVVLRPVDELLKMLDEVLVLDEVAADEVALDETVVPELEEITLDEAAALELDEVVLDEAVVLELNKLLELLTMIELEDRLVLDVDNEVAFVELEVLVPVEEVEEDVELVDDPGGGAMAYSMFCSIVYTLPFPKAGRWYLVRRPDDQPRGICTRTPFTGTAWKASRPALTSDNQTTPDPGLPFKLVTVGFPLQARAVEV